MVLTFEASPYLTPQEVKHGQLLTIGPANTHFIQEFTRQGEARLQKKIIVTFAESKKQGIFNSTSKRLCEKAWGYDTAAWAGKKVEVILATQMIRGDLTDVMFFVPPGTFKKGAMPEAEE